MGYISIFEPAQPRPHFSRPIWCELHRMEMTLTISKMDAISIYQIYFNLFEIHHGPTIDKSNCFNYKSSKKSYKEILEPNSIKAIVQKKCTVTHAQFECDKFIKEKRILFEGFEIWKKAFAYVLNFRTKFLMF